MKKLIRTIKLLGWDRIAPIALAVLLTSGIYFDSQLADNFLLKILWIIIGLLVVISISLVFVTAGFSVMRTLVKVSVGLTLIVFIGQSYCDSGMTTATSNEALGSLMGIGILYVIYEFFHTLFKTLVQYKNKVDTNDNDSKGSKWFVIILFLFFITYFTWAIYEVMTPIILSICIYG